ncbi:glycosyltransferase [Agaribacterium sp. ZY112]|uniref:glycosyltransferase n=1 Tax=Agaribacterium sp. ZY112 TaxID=3233574 RepID=UPI003525545F
MTSNSIYLTVAISTFGGRVSGALDVVEQLTGHMAWIEVVLVHQVPSEFVLEQSALQAVQLLKDKADVHYVLSQEQGLTKSRNLAISYASGAYVWLMDDDIEFVQGAFLELKLRLEQSAAACLSFQSLKAGGGLRALYAKDRAELNARDRLRVASFELILDRRFIIDHHVLLREDMGVGSNTGINMGEEAVLLSDVVRAKGLVEQHRLAVVVHPDESTGTNYNALNVYSKGVVLQRCFSGAEKLKYFLKDLLKLLKDRDGNIGTFSKRVSLSLALTRGCFGKI